jgi:hypothetical protein
LTICHPSSSSLSAAFCRKIPIVRKDFFYNHMIFSLFSVSFFSTFYSDKNFRPVDMKCACLLENSWKIYCIIYPKSCMEEFSTSSTSRWGISQLHSFSFSFSSAILWIGRVLSQLGRKIKEKSNLKNNKVSKTKSW